MDLKILKSDLISYCRWALLILLWMFSVPSWCLEPTLTEEQKEALRAISRNEAFFWPGLTPEQTASIHSAAAKFMAHLRKIHLPQGLIADILWSDYDRTRVEKYEGIGDSTTWTGVYLGVLGLEWFVERQPETYEEILRILDEFDMLTKVSGRIGYLARYAGNADEPAFIKYFRVYGGKESKNRPGLGIRAYKGCGEFANYVWLGHSSRDTYDGCAFGMAILWHYVDEPYIRSRVRILVERIGDRLIRDNWKILDGQGSHTWHTFRWRIVWTRLCLSINPEKYGHLKNSYRRMAYRYPRSGPKIPSKYREDYYPANLNFLRLFILCILEEDEYFLARYQGAMQNLYQKKANDHLNALFAALYMIATGNVNDANARATLEGMLCDYPDIPKFARKVDWRVLKIHELKNKNFTRCALLTSERVPRDFFWQRSPCQAFGGSDKPLEYPTLDFLLPYWLGRVAKIFSPLVTQNSSCDLPRSF